MNIMKPAIWISVVLILTQCGDAGVQANVSKDVPYEFFVDASETNDDNGDAGGFALIDLGSGEFDRFELVDVLINNINYEISGLPENTSGEFNMILMVEAESLPPLELVRTPEIVALENSSERILLYSAVDPNALVTLSTVDAVEDVIRSGQDFRLTLTTEFPELVQDFIITFHFDATGKVRD